MKMFKNIRCKIWGFHGDDYDDIIFKNIRLFSLQTVRKLEAVPEGQ
jgi:hypothetical protein